MFVHRTGSFRRHLLRDRPGGDAVPAGDSLLFAAGTFAAVGSRSAAVRFCSRLPWAGHGELLGRPLVGPKIFQQEKVRFLKKEYLDRTHEFYERHGGKTIIIARFVPIIRTFAPFVAGIGRMTYWSFISYNVIGGVGWVALFVFGGYFFGNMPLVKRNFSLVIFAIIFISVLPAVLSIFRQRRKNRRS